MYEKIFKRMGAIVEGTGAQRDFEKFDKDFIEKFGLPMIWVVKEGSTNLTAIGSFAKNFNEDEATRYDYVRNGISSYTYYLDHFTDGNKIFYVTEDEVREVSAANAREIIRDLLTPVVEEWKAANGPLPTNTKMEVRFSNISLSKLKELVRECEAHNDTSLMDCLKRFHQYVRTAKNQYIQVSYNPGYNEFIFCQYTNGKQGLVGGIIFHGWPETGYQTNGSVQLDPRYGWRIHT